MFMTARTTEQQHNARLRQQQREQDRRKFVDPDYDTDWPPAHACYIWSAYWPEDFPEDVPRDEYWRHAPPSGWVLVAFIPGRLTPRKLNRVRRRLRYRKQIAKGDVLRVVWLYTAARHATSTPSAPLATPRAQVPPGATHGQQVGKGALNGRNGSWEAHRSPDRVVSHPTPANGRPWRGKAARGQKPTVLAWRTKAGSRKALCKVRHHGHTCGKTALWYVAYTVQHRRVIRQRCTHHAWMDALVPAHATQVVRILKKNVRPMQRHTNGRKR